VLLGSVPTARAFSCFSCSDRLYGNEYEYCEKDVVPAYRRPAWWQERKKIEECKSHRCYVADSYEEDGTLSITSRGCELPSYNRGKIEEDYKQMGIDYEKIEEKGRTCLKMAKGVCLSGYPAMYCWRNCETDLCNGNRYQEDDEEKERAWRKKKERKEFVKGEIDRLLEKQVEGKLTAEGYDELWRLMTEDTKLSRC